MRTKVVDFPYNRNESPPSLLLESLVTESTGLGFGTRLLSLSVSWALHPNCEVERTMTEVVPLPPGTL